MMTVANALADIHWRGIEFVHGRHEDGFGVLLAGLAFLGLIVWLISRGSRESV
jgi:hypothetical protein